MDKPEEGTASPKEKRQHTRHVYERQLFLEFVGQPPLLGDSRDVSMGGAFLVTNSPPVNITPGQEGYLRLETKNNSFRIPCKVVYVAADGVALNLLGKETSFALALAMDAFEQIEMPPPMSAQVVKKSTRGKPG